MMAQWCNGARHRPSHDLRKWGVQPGHAATFIHRAGMRRA